MVTRNAVYLQVQSNRGLQPVSVADLLNEGWYHASETEQGVVVARLATCLYREHPERDNVVRVLYGYLKSFVPRLAWQISSRYRREYADDYASESVGLLLQPMSEKGGSVLQSFEPQKGTFTGWLRIVLRNMFLNCYCRGTQWHRTNNLEIDIPASECLSLDTCTEEQLPEADLRIFEKRKAKVRVLVAYIFRLWLYVPFRRWSSWIEKVPTALQEIPAGLEEASSPGERIRLLASVLHLRPNTLSLVKRRALPWINRLSWIQALRGEPLSE